MKLDIDRLSGVDMPDEYVQTVTGYVGTLMQAVGLQSLKCEIRGNPSFESVVVTSVVPFDFAPERMVSFSVSLAQSLASVAASVGVSSMSIADVSSDDRRTLMALWDSVPSFGKGSGRLVAPPELQPDMGEVEVDL